MKSKGNILKTPRRHWVDVRLKGPGEGSDVCVVGLDFPGFRMSNSKALGDLVVREITD